MSVRSSAGRFGRKRLLRSALEQLLAADRQELAHGTVRLVGQVRSLAERRIAERDGVGAPVKTVENELVFNP